jgi:cephalosporin hydroxylase
MFDTDKIANGLIAEYKTLFSGLQYRPLTILEIGIWNGGSLLLWDDYFKHPETRIVGADIHIPDLTFPPRIRTVACDQNDTPGLESLAMRYSPWDIVIDDGAHYRKETENAFAALWPHVAVGGWYVIEDWAAGYWRDRPEYDGMVELVTDLVRRVPDLGMAEARLVLEKNKALAVYRKGFAGWTE